MTAWDTIKKESLSEGHGEKQLPKSGWSLFIFCLSLEDTVLFENQVHLPEEASPGGLEQL